MDKEKYEHLIFLWELLICLGEYLHVYQHFVMETFSICFNISNTEYFVSIFTTVKLKGKYLFLMISMRI